MSHNSLVWVKDQCRQPMMGARENLDKRLEVLHKSELCLNLLLRCPKNQRTKKEKQWAVSSKEHQRISKKIKLLSQGFVRRTFTVRAKFWRTTLNCSAAHAKWFCSSREETGFRAQRFSFVSHTYSLARRFFSLARRFCSLARRWFSLARRFCILARKLTISREDSESVQNRTYGQQLKNDKNSIVGGQKN